MKKKQSQPVIIVFNYTLPVTPMLMQINPIHIFKFSLIKFHSNIHAEIFQILKSTHIFKSLFYSFLFILHMLHAKTSLISLTYATCQNISYLSYICYMPKHLLFLLHMLHAKTSLISPTYATC